LKDDDALVTKVGRAGVLASEQTDSEFDPQAVAVLSGDSNVRGVVNFKQFSKNGPVTVTGELKNLDPLAKRGFHIQCVPTLCAPASLF
jgi:hypothetical protein